jgi:PKD repeat protein
VGDVVTYTWNWGDGSPTVTGTTATRTYATPGTYTIELTARDGWGKATTVTKTIVLQEPSDNSPPTPALAVSCAGLVCSATSAGTTDPEGDQIRYSWNWGDGSPAVTTANATRTYAASGTYTVTLTATDGWNRSATATRQVTVAP